MMSKMESRAILGGCTMASRRPMMRTMWCGSQPPRNFAGVEFGDSLGAQNGVRFGYGSRGVMGSWTCRDSLAERWDCCVCGRSKNASETTKLSRSGFGLFEQFVGHPLDVKSAVARITRCGANRGTKEGSEGGVKDLNAGTSVLNAAMCDTPLLQAIDDDLVATSDDTSGEDGRWRLRLELQNVHKKYGERVVVDGVSLYIEQGEVVGLLGPNGAGKSTTFNIAVGREWATSGAVRLGAMDLTRMPLERRARLGIGYMTQEASVFRGLTVRDNILLILQETGVPTKQQEDRLKALIGDFQLHDVEHTLGRALSGGERRRTELARVLASNCSGGPPKILLVDEPFAGVDPIGVQEIQKLLTRLRRQNDMGILITDHNVSETLRICDRAYVVHKGRVMASGSPESLCKDEYVRRYYLGDGFPDLTWHPK